MAVKLNIEVDKRSAERLSRALSVLGEDGAAWFRNIWDDLGQMLTGAIRSRAQGSIKSGVQYKGVGRGKTVGGIRAAGIVKHPGSRSMEFGRNLYWTGYRIQNRKFVGGSKVGRRGQAPKPYIGIVDGGHAIGEVTPKAKKAVEEAIAREWGKM